MQVETAKIRFKNGYRLYSFASNGLDLKAGDNVIVETEKGNDLGTVIKAKEMIDPTTLSTPLKNVIKIAPKEVLEKAEMFDKEAQKYSALAKKLIKESGLDMKYVAIEASYDNSRYIIKFTSTNRVDFRDLVKKLAEALKKRVELKQIDPREEARLLGGIGPCGKECCCTQDVFFVDESLKVAKMKMARIQNMPLNLSSISGCCGQLLCCIAFENETYAEALKILPKVNTQVTTPDGVGVVAYNNLLKLEVDVKFQNGEETKIKTYPVSQLKFKKEEK